MIPNLTLIVIVGALFATGVYLILERSLTRILVGLLLVANGTSVLFLAVSGPENGVPIVGTGPEALMTDPLPQAMVLTAIVIGLGMTAFVLALAYRSWQLYHNDEVQDDVEDRRIVRRAQRDEQSASFEPADTENVPSDEHSDDEPSQQHVSPGTRQRPAGETP